jgi:glycosyltransferase involved in cell wall biosynthesis
LSTYDVGIPVPHTESGPIALIEYLAAGLPFVVTDGGEIPAASDSLRRWVVPPNPAELARTVRAVLAQSPEERASAAEALAFATNNLSIERTVDSIEAVYRLVTRRRGA